MTYKIIYGNDVTKDNWFEIAELKSLSRVVQCGDEVISIDDDGKETYLGRVTRSAITEILCDNIEQLTSRYRNKYNDIALDIVKHIRLYCAGDDAAIAANQDKKDELAIMMKNVGIFMMARELFEYVNRCGGDICYVFFDSDRVVTDFDENGVCIEEERENQGQMIIDYLKSDKAMFSL